MPPTHASHSGSQSDNQFNHSPARHASATHSHFGVFSITHLPTSTVTPSFGGVVYLYHTHTHARTHTCTVILPAVAKLPTLCGHPQSQPPPAPAPSAVVKNHLVMPFACLSLPSSLSVCLPVRHPVCPSPSLSACPSVHSSLGSQISQQVS